MSRTREPIHIGKAIEEEARALFAGSPEPRRSRCRFEYIDKKIKEREKLGKPIPDVLKRLRAKQKEASRQAYEQEKQSA